MLIKGRAEYPNGTVRFRPSAFKAHLFLIKATFNERRKHLLTRVSSIALIVRNDVKLHLNSPQPSLCDWAFVLYV